MPKATKRERQRQNRDTRREAVQEAEKRQRRNRTARNIALLVLPVVALFVILQLTKGDDDSSSSSSASSAQCSDRKPATPVKTDTYRQAPALEIDPAQAYEVRMHTSCGDIPITLDAAQAPQAVNSFLYLVQREYFNGTTFHRIVTDFVNQGGDPTGDGTGGPGYTLPDEPPAGPYEVGDVAMANRGPGTTGSQFFLIVSKNGAARLAPGLYSILGHMSDKGLKVAKKINTFGSPDTAGEPSKTIYVYDIGIILPESPATTTTPGGTTTTAGP